MVQSERRKREITDGRICVRTVSQLVDTIPKEGVKVEFCSVKCEICGARACGIVTYAIIGTKKFSPHPSKGHICGECDKV